MPDPYDHVREAFHITADGLMDWNDPPERAVSRSNALGASYRESDIPTLEKAAESLSRAGDFTNAVALWALALRVRHGG
jgi:hypothetical protein